MDFGTSNIINISQGLVDNLLAEFDETLFSNLIPNLLDLECEQNNETDCLECHEEMSFEESVNVNEATTLLKEVSIEKRKTVEISKRRPTTIAKAKRSKSV